MVSREKKPFSKIILCNGKVQWMLKVLHKTIDANEGHLFVRVQDNTVRCK